ncbi:helix-turn-helix domain-containing protein, partial [Sphingomonas oligophenolica]
GHHIHPGHFSMKIPGQLSAEINTRTLERNDEMQPAPPAREAPAESPLADSRGHGVTPISVRISTAVKMTGIGRSKLYELIGEGAIDVVKIGSSTLIRVASLHRLLERNRR